MGYFDFLVFEKNLLRLETGFLRYIRSHSVTIITNETNQPFALIYIPIAHKVYYKIVGRPTNQYHHQAYEAATTT